MIFLWLFTLLNLIQPCISTEVITRCTFEEDNVEDCKMSVSLIQNLDMAQRSAWKIESCETPSAVPEFDHTYGNTSGHFISREIIQGIEENPRLLLPSFKGGGKILMNFWYKMNVNGTTIRISSDHNSKNYIWNEPNNDWKQGVFRSSVENGEVIEIESFTDQVDYAYTQIKSVGVNDDNAKVQIDDLIVKLTRPEAWIFLIRVKEGNGRKGKQEKRSCMIKDENDYQLF